MSTRSLGDIYHDPALADRLPDQVKTAQPLEEVLASLDPLASVPFMPYLDELAEVEDPYLGDIRRLISALPSDIVYTNYGLPGLVWAAANGVRAEDIERHLWALRRYAEVNPSVFEKARRWGQRNWKNTTGQFVLGQYILGETTLGAAVGQIDLGELLKQFTTGGRGLSERHLGHYALVPVMPTGYDPQGYVDGSWNRAEKDVSFRIRLDAPFGLALTYRGRPNAVVAFAVTPANELMIYQIQGVQGKRSAGARLGSAESRETISSRGLAPLDWPRLLVTVAFEVARQLGINRIGIQSAENNEWVGPNRVADEAHLGLEQAQKIYDMTARNMGFELGDDHNWHTTSSAASPSTIAAQRLLRLLYQP